MNFETLKQVAVAQAAGATQAERLVDAGEVFTGAQINVALHKVERAALWRFSEAETTLTVPAGSHTPTAPPTDLAVPLLAYNVSQDQPLLFHDERQERRRGDREGHVTEYGIWGGELRFYPAPRRDTEVELRYYRTWPDLVDPEDEPLFPETWHDLLADYATSRILLRLQPTAGKFLPSSAAEPFHQSFAVNLEAMTQSDLVMTTWDAVRNHAWEEALWRGEGLDW